MTPGVKMGEGGDALGQQYNTPQKVIANGTDVIIVGRGVYGATDSAAAARKYAEAGWESYLARVGCTGAAAVPAQVQAAAASAAAASAATALSPPPAAAAAADRPGSSPLVNNLWG